MRGFSLTQPWATLVALGAKKIETRSWSTSYRGEILIHAAKGFPREVQEMCADEPFLAVLKAAGFTNTKELPRGVIVAVARLVAVKRTEEIRCVASEQEQAFGDYSPNRYGWLLADVRALKTPVPAAHVDRDGSTKPGGALGLWSVPQVLIDLIAGQGVL